MILRKIPLDSPPPPLYILHFSFLFPGNFTCGHFAIPCDAACQYKSNDGQSCDDGDACTFNDVCKQGAQKKNTKRKGKTKHKHKQTQRDTDTQTDSRHTDTDTDG